HYVVRTAGLFGQGGRNFVTAIAERALRGEALRVVGDQICQRTYAPDLAAALLELAVTPVAFGTFHVTNEGAGSWYSFAEMVVERLGREVALQPVSTAEWAAPAWRPAWSVLSGARWSRVGMTPLRPVEEAVAEYLESWLATRPT
ncbi:MAG: sugar nucleotide-binding protein, partial [Armatimonadetes bacterium]|nr:sugar nucleotide-binding protein [Armatimonadota bacterium]